VDSVTDLPVQAQDCPICRDTVDVPVDVMAALAQMPQRLREALRTAPDREYDGWSPGFIAVHLADLEVSRGWRIRTILAEADPPIGGVDVDAWAEQLSYGKRDFTLALETFTANRAANLELLRLTGDAGLARPYHHPELGALTLGNLIEHTADHDLAHLQQIVGGKYPISAETGVSLRLRCQR